MRKCEKCMLDFMCNERMRLKCKTKCRICLLRRHCDEQTEYICKTNEFCKYIKDRGNHGHWKPLYVCSKCGKIEMKQFSECQGCHANMDGLDQCIAEEETKVKKWYTITFSAKLDDDDIRAMNTCFYDAMDNSMLIHECANLKIKDDPNDEEGGFKKWRIITFSAKLDEDDVRAMKSCFYDAMNEAMVIKECADLKIKEEKDYENN